jgi:hypothetical protein
MAITKFDSYANEVQKENEEYNRLLCTANGCPMEWTIDAGKRLCSFHAWSDPHKWPRITDELITKQALGNLPTFQKVQDAVKKPDFNAKTLTIAEKQAILLELKKVVQGFATRDPKEWARRLKAKELAGERLNKIQRDAWRDALGERA